MQIIKTFFILTLLLISSVQADDYYDYMHELAPTIKIGKTPEERQQLADQADRNFDCRNLDLNEKMTVADYIATCVNGIRTDDGCRINIEKACVNGKEVYFWDERLGISAGFGFGFDGRQSNGLSEKDFSDSSQMYKKISLPNGKTTQLCSRVPEARQGVTPAAFENNLPSGNYVIESIPPTVNPNNMFASMTLHYKITVSGTTKSVEVQLRDSESVDKQLTNNGRAAPFITRADTLDKAVRSLFNDNLVRCKKLETFVGKENSRRGIDGDPSTFAIEDKQKYEKAQKFWLNANHGLNKQKLSAKFASLFKN